MIISILFIILGFIILIKGADWVVIGASGLAKKNNISDLAIGLTIVAFGTSAPELAVNSFAALQNNPDFVFGNVIGSNNFNLFISLGVVGLISPIVVQSRTVWKEIPISFGAIIVMFLLCNDFFLDDSKILSRIDGFILISIFCLFIFYVFKQMKNETPIMDTTQHNISNIKIWGLIIIGITGLVFGGKLVVNNAEKVAIAVGMSDRIIGLTILAVGTSLPELATSVVAAFKNKNDMAIGNIIGSNIFNIFLILSVSTFFKPLEYKSSFNIDIYLLSGGTIFLFIAMFTGKKKKLDRWEAGLLLTIFILYTIFLIV